MLFDLQNLQKHYNNFEAIKSITLQAPEGSIGLLGPNGAGKSTLIKTLLGLLSFTTGSAHVLGFKLPGEALKVRQHIGYMPENDCYLPYMSAVEYVSFGGQLAGMPRRQSFGRAHELLHYVGLGDERYRKLETFSTGMKQRVKLAQALVHGPKLIFLDEPTNGLDPNGRDEMLDLIQEVKSCGVNVLLSSHLLADVERVCDSIIVMNKGEIIHVGAIHTLKEDSAQLIEVMTHNQNAKFKEILEAKGLRVEAQGPKLKVYLTPEHESKDILSCAVSHDIQLRHFMPGELSLESAFLGLLNTHGS